MSVMDEVTAARQAAAKQWGGPSHDDAINKPLDWIKYVEMQCDKAIEETAGHVMNSKPMTDDIRARLIKIAGLALDGLDSIDRIEGARQRQTGMSPAFGAPYKGDTPQPSPDDIYRLMTGYGATSEQAENIANGPDWAAIREGMISNDKMAAHVLNPDSWAAGADFALNAIALNDLCFVDERMRDAAVMRAADECRAEKRRLLGEPQPQRD